MDLSASQPDAIALTFARHLVAGDFAAAHQMLTAHLRNTISLEQLQTAYEQMIAIGQELPDQVEVISVLTEWLERQEADWGWVYVAIASSHFAEGVAVVVTTEEDQGMIREITWGRP
ncbi:MAG: hypothetical protein MUF49_01525 [Oculatellaceae cyanobacterium Prado106]|nr:hypothetical protein [Oculatellaceae cyanobacterium Prado106]